MEIRNKNALVTGASSGLGKAVTETLCLEGVKVFALSRYVEQATLPDSVTKIPVDIKDFRSIDDAFNRIDKENVQINILVNCAGVGLIKNFELTTREEIMNVLNINLNGNIYITQEVYKRMIPNKSGHIINVSSTSGIKARPYEPIYVASKWGLRGFTESLRIAAAEYAIRVTGIYPGGMQTNFWKNDSTRDISKFMKPEDIAEEIVHILKTPESISPAEYVIERGI